MTSPKDFFYDKSCEKMDPLCVDAFFELTADPDLATGIILKNSWEDTGIDLEPMIKAGETDTFLALTPTLEPESLQYTSEKHVDCITGHDLSRIISMQYLKDVDQSDSPEEGDIYKMGDDGLFELFNLDDFMEALAGDLEDIIDRISALEGIVDTQTREINTIKERLTNIEGRLTTIENILEKPANIPANARVAWGNINNYGDITNNNLKTSGIYTHDPNTNVINDQYFS